MSFLKKELNEGCRVIKFVMGKAACPSGGRLISGQLAHPGLIGLM